MPRAVSAARPLSVAGASLIDFTTIRDARGVLSAGEVGAHLPFTPLRFYALTDFAPGTFRVVHPNLELHQLIVCLSGSCTVTADDAAKREDVTLTSPASGLYLAPMVWSSLHDFSSDAAVVVLASDVYREDDYIRDYDHFLRVKLGR